MSKDVKRALMIAEENRIARGRAMGFDMDTPLYHGTSKDIQAFEPRRASRWESMALKGTHLADNPEFANQYAQGKGANVMPVRARGKFLDAGKLVYEGSPEHEILNQLVKRRPNLRVFWDKDHEGKRVAPPLVSYLDAVPPAAAERIVKAAGYDGVRYPARYGDPSGRVSARTNAMVVFDPKNIRSQFAQFDPEQSESSDITKARGGSADKGIRRALMIAREIGSPERKQAFEQWGGSPERWYHGTSKDVDFSKFKVGRHGAWFTRNPDTASMYAKENDSQGYKHGPDETGRLTFLRTNTRSRVIPVHLKFGKTHTGQLPDDVMGSSNYKKAQSDWFDRLRAQGYDSWVPEGGDVAVILKDPTNIKSAIGNVGTFDPNDPDITKARGGSADKDIRRALMIARATGGKIEFKQDNPAVSRGNTEWLASKQRVAQSDPALLRGAVTGYLNDVAHIPVDMLEGVPGANKENPVPGAYKYDALMRDVKKEGWRPTPILVGVNHKGKPHILEGNHRVAVARALGKTHIPGDIRWWNGGEEVEGDWHPKNVVPRLQSYKRASGGPVPPFKLKSGAADLIEQKGQKKALPAQFAAMPGIKPDEIKHSGFADLPAKAIPREEAAKHLREHAVPIEETTYAGNDPKSAKARYGRDGSLELPGGQNYREVLLHTPPEPHVPSPELNEAHKRMEAASQAYDEALLDQLSKNPRLSDDDYRRASNEVDAARIAFNRLEEADQRKKETAGFRSGHWDDVPNVLAHIRMSDRKGPNGEKVLHVEEVQSDWGQKGREEGFAEPPAKIYEVYNTRSGNKSQPFETLDEARKYHAALPETVREMTEVRDRDLPGKPGILHGPYVDNTQKWTDLALKRVLHEAAHGGYDKVVVTPGNEQNKRYSLAKHATALEHSKNPNGTYRVDAHLPDGDNHLLGDELSEQELSAQVGKEIAQKIVRGEGETHPSLNGKILRGLDLEVGGSGMRGYYDNILPKRLQALAQQHDPKAKVHLNGHALAPAEFKPDYDAASDYAADYGRDERDREQLVEQHVNDQFRDYQKTAKDTPLHSLDVTPQMRDSIKANGFNQFKRGGEVNEHPAWIPTRLVTSKKYTPTEGERHIVDLASLKQTPDVFKSNVDLVRAYPNLPRNVSNWKDHDKVADAFVEHVKNNLLALHDAVPAHVRSRSKLWYDGARAITDRWSKQYALPDHSIAGALAALSPQKDWYQNVSLAERVLNAMRSPLYNSHQFDKAMAKTFTSRPSLNKPDYAGVRKLLSGRTLADLDALDMTPDAKAKAKALWIRLHDETHNDPAHRIITPEGEQAGYVTTAKGARAKVGWGSLTEIGKAIQAIENADNPAALSQLMGEKHKVRNFYNNILVPNSPHGDVTIDTHAIAAGLLRPLSGNSLEVAHNFANYPGANLPTARGTALTGIQGTYPLYAEAYRRAAHERGILPREMQSITWEAIRGMFPDTAKTPAHNARINAIWNQHRSGKIGQNEAHRQIFAATAPEGIPHPSWFVGGPSGADESDRGALGSGTLPDAAVRRPAAGAPIGRAGGGAATAIPSRPGSASAQSLIDRALQLVRATHAS